MRFRSLLPLMICFILLNTGCAGDRSKTKIPQNAASLTSTQVVRYYYESLSQGNISDAKQFMSAKLIKSYKSSADGLRNIKNISDIKISKSYKIKGNNNKVQVDAEFHAEYYHIYGTGNGPQTRFLYLSRPAKNKPWVIDSIGTGP